MPAVLILVSGLAIGDGGAGQDAATAPVMICPDFKVPLVGEVVKDGVTVGRVELQPGRFKVETGTTTSVGPYSVTVSPNGRARFTFVGETLSAWCRVDGNRILVDFSRTPYSRPPFGFPGGMGGPRWVLRPAWMGK